MLALGIPQSHFELGHTMIFFRHGAAARLHELESLTKDELARRLHDAVGDFARTATAKRTIARCAMHWARWRRMRQAGTRRRAEQAARATLSTAVHLMRLRHAAIAQLATRRQLRADEGALAVRSANNALGRLKQVWQHAGSLEEALRAAEAALRHRALPSWYAKRGSECEDKLREAREQLQRLKRYEEQERIELTKQVETPTPTGGFASEITPPAGGASPRTRWRHQALSRVHQLVRAAEAPKPLMAAQATPEVAAPPSDRTTAVRSHPSDRHSRAT